MNTMEKYAIVFEATRTDYQVSQTADRDAVMTVGALRSYLEGLNDDDLVIISHDDGFTYGTLHYKDDGSVNEFE